MNLLCAMETQDIISIVIASISFAAMLVSCIALCKNTKQFKATFKEQRKAINLSLLDKRLEVLNYFENVRGTGDDAIEGILTGRHAMIDQFYMLFGYQLIAEYESIQAFEDDEMATVGEQRGKIYYKYLTSPMGANEETLKDIVRKKTELKAYEDAAFSTNATDFEKDKFKTYSQTIFGGSDDYYYLTIRYIELKQELLRKESTFKKHLSEEIRESIRGKEID